MKALVTAEMEVNELACTIDGYVSYSIDKSYGEDADGNRATIRTFVEEVNQIGCYDFEGDEIELDESEKEEAETILTEKFLKG